MLPSPVARHKHSTGEGNALPSNIPMREGEKLHFSTEDPSVVYLNPFGNPVTGYLYITDYKVYFKGNEGEQATTIQVPYNTCSLLVYLIIECL